MGVSAIITIIATICSGALAMNSLGFFIAASSLKGSCDIFLHEEVGTLQVRVVKSSEPLLRTSKREAKADL